MIVDRRTRTGSVESFFNLETESWERVLKYFCILILLSVSIAHVLCQTSLFGDGSAFLVAILQFQTFLEPDPTRNFATIITQIPLLALLKLGLKDINILVYAQSFSLTFTPTTFWICSLVILLNDVLFWPFILLVSVVYLNTSFFLIGESHVAYSISACCIAILLSHKSITVTRAISLLLMSFVVMRTYETLLFLGPLLGLMTVSRLYEMRKQSTIVIILSGAALLFFVSSVIAASSILAPTQSASLSDAFSGTKDLYRNRQLILSLVLSVIYFICVFHGETKPLRRAWAIVAIAALLLLIFPANWASPPQYYYCRVIVALWLFAFGFVAFVIRLGPENLERLSKLLRRMPILVRSVSGVCEFFSQQPSYRGVWIGLPFSLLTILAAADIYHSIQFHKFLEKFANEINSRTGIVTLETTNILDQGGLNYGWHWTYPSISLLLRADESKAIVLNPKDYGGWQPFDPRTSLPDLRKYYR